MHDSVSAFDVSEGLGDRTAVDASDVGVVPGVVSLRACGFFQGDVSCEWGGSPAAVQSDGSVFYLLSTQSDAYMSDVGLQVMSPGVSGSLVDGDPFLQTALEWFEFLAYLTFSSPSKRLESLHL